MEITTYDIRRAMYANVLKEIKMHHSNKLRSKRIEDEFICKQNLLIRKMQDEEMAVIEAGRLAVQLITLNYSRVCDDYEYESSIIATKLHNSAVFSSC